MKDLDLALTPELSQVLNKEFGLDIKNTELNQKQEHFKENKEKLVFNNSTTEKRPILMQQASSPNKLCLNKSKIFKGKYADKENLNILGRPIYENKENWRNSKISDTQSVFNNQETNHKAQIKRQIFKKSTDI